MKISQFDVVSAGEVLVDLVSHRKGEHLTEAALFEKLPGGSAANLAINMAQMGNSTVLLSAVGNDGFGDYLKKNLKAKGVEVGCLQVVPDLPTSLVVASDMPGSPEFKAYRGADVHIRATCFPRELLQHCRIFHTTLFALSKNPSRKSILELAELAHEKGAQLSLDMNYAAQVWSDRHKALAVLDRILEMNPLVRLSEKDASYLYREPLHPHKIIERLLQRGARLVALTVGQRGSYVASAEYPTPLLVPANEVQKMANMPGAGDVYWSGFLHMYLKGKPLEECAIYGSRVAAAMLQKPNPQPKKQNIVA